MALPQAVEADLAKAVRNNHVLRLPLYSEDPRTAKKDRADSVLRKGLSDWLLTDDGKRWRQRRQELYDEAE